MRPDYDVAIVGYGPVGATLANLLGVLGLHVVVIEREPSVYHHPRAGHMDGEVVRVFQSAGLADEIVANAYVNPGMRFVNAADELLLDWPRPPAVGPEGWHASYRFHQPHLESVLRAANDKRANVEVLLRHEGIAAHEDDGGAVLTVRNLENGEVRELRCRYLIGCDGARSMVRKCMGVGLEDLKSHDQWLIVDVKLKGARPDLPKETIQLCDPARPITMANMVGNRRRWELMLMPGDTPEDMVEPATYWPLLARWITPEEAEVERAVVYTFHSVIAERWRKGPMILAGDACHQTPPFMGQGMCAGIRDAANLAWKLAAVIRGDADPSLLDTYQDERSPHVREFIETAVRLGNFVHVTDPAWAARRDMEMRANPRLMETPSPRLGPGLQGDAPPPAGTRSRQVRLATGERLDDRVGLAFALLAREAAAEAAARELCRIGAKGVIVLSESDRSVTDYLDELDVAAVLIRPDRYILGVARTAADVPALLSRIPVAARG